MEAQDIKKSESKWIHITVTQLICVTIIIICLLATKFFFKGTYTEIKQWYQENICNDTDINEVLQSGDKDEI